MLTLLRQLRIFSNLGKIPTVAVNMVISVVTVMPLDACGITWNNCNGRTDYGKLGTLGFFFDCIGFTVKPNEPITTVFQDKASATDYFHSAKDEAGIVWIELFGVTDCTGTERIYR